MRLPITDSQRRWWTLVAMCCALFMSMLDSTIITVALPTIQRDLEVSIPGLEWTINAYSLTFAVLIVTGGRLGDLFGHVRVFLIGVAVFAVASGLIALAQDAPWLIGWRAVQGAGAALMSPASLAIVIHAFPAEKRGRAIGLWSGVSASGLAIGPVIGGVLVEHVSWQSIFLVNLPVAALAIVITLVAARESRDETAARTIDFPGVISLSTGLTALFFALIEGNRWGWDSPRIIGLFAVAAVALAAFAVIEQRVRLPMVDFRYFTSRAFLGVNLVGLGVCFSLVAVTFLLALFLQNVQGYDALQAGLRLAPSTLVVVVISPISGRIVDRLGPRLPVTVGALLLTGALLWLSFLQADSPYWFLLGPLLLLGAGLGSVISPLTTAGVNAVNLNQTGGASGIMTMTRMLAGALGVALLGAIVSATGRSVLEARLPGATPAQLDRLAEGLGTGAVSAGAGGRVADATTEAFLDGLAVGMRISAVLTLSAAAGALLMIERRGKVPCDAGEPHAEATTA